MGERSHLLRLPARARLASRFIISAALCIDLLLTGFSRWGTSRTTRLDLASILQGWDLGKSIGITLAMAAIALTARSLTLGVFAAIFGLIAILDRTGAHHTLAVWVVGLGLYPNVYANGPPAYAYGELVILTGFSVLAVVVIWFTRTGNRDLVLIRRHLLIILGALWVFAVALDFLVAAWGSPRWRLLEENGERGVMSILLGYVLGLLITPSSRPVRVTKQIKVARPP